MREAILGGLAGAALGAAVTLFTQFRNWRREEEKSREETTQRLVELAEQGEQFQKTLARRDRELDQQEEQFQQQLRQQVHELDQREEQLREQLAQRSRELDQREAHLQRELEHQTREALRQGYTELLVSQRRCREACLRLAEAGGAERSSDLAAEATAAHDAFLDAYHLLNLDSTTEMWQEVRGLRDVLDQMLDYAKAGRDVVNLGDLARDARQNIERRFRERLGHQPHQKRRPLGVYDKVEEQQDLGT
jgi:gas vesicle protein